MFKKLEEYDLMIMLMAIALTCFGVVMVYSASSVMAAKRFHDGFFFLKRQGLFALLGFALMLGTMRIDYQFWRKLAAPILLVCLVLLVLVLIPGIGGKAGGASRWIKLPGFNLQPSEMAKMALIMYMAYSLDRKQDKIKQLGPGFVSYMLILRRDAGSPAQTAGYGFGPDPGGGRHHHALCRRDAAGLHHFDNSAVDAVSLFSGHERRLPQTAHSWRFSTRGRTRRTAASRSSSPGWPWERAGVFGQGLGEGKQKLFYLPEAHTDFILSVVGEELGFLGVIVIIGMFFLLVQRAMRIAVAAPDTFGRFLALGIAVLFGIEATVNMGVVTGLLPTKGLALPFISYGGSSLLISLFAVGILLNISSGLKISSISLKEEK